MLPAMAARPLADLPDWARELLADGRVGHLGLLDEEDRPRVQPVTYALAGEALYTTIDDKPKRGEPARVRRLRRRPWAALTVDVYDDDWSRLAWVQVLGRVEVLAPEDDPAGLDALRAKYEQYAERPPGGPLLRLGPERALWWRYATSD
jgi:PPOX class probable F420-dependent enzyme